MGSIVFDIDYYNYFWIMTDIGDLKIFVGNQCAKYEHPPPQNVRSTRYKSYRQILCIVDLDI